MATLKKFEDIETRQQSRELCKLIHLLTLKPSFSKDFGLVKQIKNASGSAMDNIVEGFEREGNAEFKQFWSLQKVRVKKLNRNCTGLLIATILPRRNSNRRMTMQNWQKQK